MGSAASFGVFPYASVIYRYPRSKYPLQVESAEFGARHSRETALSVMSGHRTIPRLPNPAILLLVSPSVFSPRVRIRLPGASIRFRTPKRKGIRWYGHLVRIVGNEVQPLFHSILRTRSPDVYE